MTATLHTDEGRRVRLQGPYLELHGHTAVSVTLDDRPGVMLVRDEGRPLADGAAVEVRDGTVADPGELVATGVLRDPLAT